MYAKISAGAVVSYPYDLNQIRRDFPNTSFPADLSGADLKAFGVVPVAPSAPPSGAGMVAVEGTPVLSGGAWLQQWALAPAPPPEVPEEVTMRQARLALLGAGLLAGVDAAINAMPSPAKEAATIEWEYASGVRRDSPLIGALASALGLSSAAVDGLFISAATL